MATIHNPLVFQVFSLIGVASVLICSLTAAVFYRGKQNEKYSPLNHFISELGEIGVSRLGAVFNLGLIICGLSLIPSSVILGILLPGVWAKMGLTAGIISGISLSLVGVFPMNNLTPHARAATAYFRSGLLMILFFTMAIASQSGQLRILPWWVSLVGVPAILAFGFFLVYIRITYKPRDEPLARLEMERPPFWGTAAAEWMIFLTTVPWILVVAILLR